MKSLASPLKARFWIWLLLPWLSGCYVVEQGWGQLERRWAQVPLEQADIEDPELAALLAEVPAIKAFGQERLGLKRSGNYTAYLAVEGSGVSHVVTAAPKLELKPYTWWFPLVGSVPYKGFFDPADARALAEELEAQGYDIHRFSPPAYSTLGWFSDPITTPMLRQGRLELIETLLHEMAHATLYVQGQGDFNEQLASFVGRKGAQLYLRGPGGWSPERWAQAQADQTRRQEAAQWVRAWLPRFEALYAERDLDHQAKLERREELFGQMSGQFEERFGQRRRFNNALLLQYRRYRDDDPGFAELFERAQGDWPRFWQLARAEAQRLD